MDKGLFARIAWQRGIRMTKNTLMEIGSQGKNWRHELEANYQSRNAINRAKTVTERFSFIIAQMVYISQIFGVSNFPPTYQKSKSLTVRINCFSSDARKISFI